MALATTGCPTISVTSDTPLFSDICQRSRLSFHELNGHSAGFDILKKNVKIFFRVRVRARYKPSLVFRLGLVLSKFTFSAGIQLFGLKTTSHGKPDLKKSFSRSDEVGVKVHEFFGSGLPCEVVFRPENWVPAENGEVLEYRVFLYPDFTLILTVSQIWPRKWIF